MNEVVEATPSPAAFLSVGLAVKLSQATSSAPRMPRLPDGRQPTIAAAAGDWRRTEGGRAMIAADGIDMAVRVTLASPNGGVARVIRYDLRGEQGTLNLRRFTGHPSTGWWLWGGDAPRATQVTPAQRTEIATLTRAVMGVTGSVGGSEELCQAGEQTYIEVALAGRATSFSRPCVANTDVAGRLALRLSEIAGSRTEEELSRVAVAELLEADRAFAVKAAADGVPARLSERLPNCMRCSWRMKWRSRSF